MAENLSDNKIKKCPVASRCGGCRWIGKQAIARILIIGPYFKGSQQPPDRDNDLVRPAVLDQTENLSDNKIKKCPVASRCGGCRWIGKDYQEQLKAKQARFRRLLDPKEYCSIILLSNPYTNICSLAGST
mgnify:CR=1 FL=1